MNKRILTVILVLVIALTLCGCQLAKSDGSADISSDRLVGVFVTTEHLDLLDHEGYLQENIHRIVEGESFTDRTIQDQNRVYAVFSEESYQDNTGEAHTAYSYEFEDLDGMILASYQINDNISTYYTSAAEEGICNVHVRSGGSDQGISGTIWVTRDTGDIIFYMNPVYQTSDGQVYLVPGSGLHISSATAGQSAHSFSETISATSNGETAEQTFTVEVTIDIAQPAETVTLIQMTDKDTEIRKDTFQADNLPKEFTPEEETAYIIVKSAAGSETHHQLSDPENDTISVFIPLDTQICIQKDIPVNW